MFGTIKFGKVLGIDLIVHGTFWLLPLYVFFSGAMSGDVSEAAFSVAVVLAAFACVAMHEYGHALAARYYGVGTRDITLYPLGGVARLERMPSRPVQEIVIALAGPAVNLVIAAGLLAAVVAGNVAVPGGFSLSHLEVAERFVVALLVSNVILLVFNLLPAFPMDGGRVLRAALSLGMGRVRATRAAVAVGTVMAGLFLLVGAGLLPNPLTGDRETSFSLMLVAVVVYMLGQAELAAARVQAARTRWRDWSGGYETARGSHETSAGDPRTEWVWDPVRRVWSLWHNGVLVREVPPA